MGIEGVPAKSVRIPPAMSDAARAAHPELSDDSLSTLLRAGLLLLAGYALHEAVKQARGQAGSGPYSGIVWNRERRKQDDA